MPFNLTEQLAETSNYSRPNKTHSSLSSKSVLLVPQLKHAIGVDFHYRKNYVYYTDVADDVVTRVSVSHSKGNEKYDRKLSSLI